jgi:hypothetical protein
MCGTRSELESKYAQSSVALSDAVKRRLGSECVKKADEAIERAAKERDSRRKALIEHIEQHRC